MITGFDVDGPAGDLAHYTQAPTSAVNPSYSYDSGHGDLAAEANHASARTRLLRLDPWGKPVTAPGGSDLQELYTGRWDSKHDQVTSLIEMGARPFEPSLGRFLSVDPVDGGSANEYDYALQDPANAYDLDGEAVPLVVGIIVVRTAPVLIPLGARVFRGGPASRAAAPGARRQAVAEAWKLEQAAVARGGGSRAWSFAQRAELLKTGRVKGFEGHHINSVARYPRLAGDPRNVVFVTRAEHLAAHGGRWQNPTRGRLIMR